MVLVASRSVSGCVACIFVPLCDDADRLILGCGDVGRLRLGWGEGSRVGSMSTLSTRLTDMDLCNGESEETRGTCRFYVAEPPNLPLSPMRLTSSSLPILSTTSSGGMVLGCGASGLRSSAILAAC